MNIFIKFECDIKVLKPTGGVYCEETRDGWLYSLPDRYSVDLSNLRGIVRKFLDEIHFCYDSTTFIGKIKVKTDRYFGERLVDIRVRDRGGGNFYHSMDIEYSIWRTINNILERFEYRENFKADTTIDLKSV